MLSISKLLHWLLRTRAVTAAGMPIGDRVFSTDSCRMQLPRLHDMPSTH